MTEPNSESNTEPKTERTTQAQNDLTGLRVDKWLWAARLYKTRAQAADDIAKGRVSVNDQVAKASRELRVGDTLTLRHSGVVRSLAVLGLSKLRGPAPVAQLLYQESAQSIAARQEAAVARRMGTEPALALEHGRPTKRDRRELAQWQRWSATAEDPDA